MDMQYDVIIIFAAAYPHSVGVYAIHFNFTYMKKILELSKIYMFETLLWMTFEKQQFTIEHF